MKTFLTTLLFLTIVTTEVVMYLEVYMTHEITLTDSLLESEKDGEKESSEDESEKKKDIVDTYLGKNHLLYNYWNVKNGSSSIQGTDPYLEILIPPPDHT